MLKCVITSYVISALLYHYYYIYIYICVCVYIYIYIYIIQKLKSQKEDVLEWIFIKKTHFQLSQITGCFT